MTSAVPSHLCRCIVLVAVLCIASGGCSSEGNRSTSQDEITEFLQENPEYADPGPQSESAPLGLER